MAAKRLLGLKDEWPLVLELPLRQLGYVKKNDPLLSFNQCATFLFMRATHRNVVLRPAREVDTNLARAIHHAALKDVVIRQFGAWDEQAQDRFFDQDWVTDNFEMILIDGTTCGYLRTETNATYVEVHEINIHPIYQNRGVGSLVLKDIISTAGMASLPVRLQVLLQNKALKLYQKLGFVEVGHTDTHLKMQLDAV